MGSVAPDADLSKLAITDFFVEEDAKRIAGTGVSAVLSAGSWGAGLRARHPETRVITPVDLRAFALADPASGDLLYYVWSWRSLSTIRECEQALCECEARLQGLTDSETALVARCDLEGCLTYANDATCRFLGKSHSDLIGTRYFDYVHPEDRERVKAGFAKLVEPPYRLDIELRIALPSGGRWFRVDNCAIRDAEGRITEIQGFGRDVTEEKAARTELLERSAVLEAVGQSTEELLR